jgi:hypothetical protein
MAGVVRDQALVGGRTVSSAIRAGVVLTVAAFIARLSA